MAENLNVKRREKLGGGNNRRLRRTGRVPAVLYGHGEASVPLTIYSVIDLGALVVPTMELEIRPCRPVGRYRPRDFLHRTGVVNSTRGHQVRKTPGMNPFRFPSQALALLGDDR